MSFYSEHKEKLISILLGLIIVIMVLILIIIV